MPNGGGEWQLPTTHEMTTTRRNGWPLVFWLPTTHEMTTSYRWQKNLPLPNLFAYNPPPLKSGAVIPGNNQQQQTAANNRNTNIMVTIRLARSGAKKRPFYHITVADSRYSRDGRFIERIGFFNPVARGQEERLRVDLVRVDHWLSQGAQLTDRVRKLTNEVRKTA